MYRCCWCLLVLCCVFHLCSTVSEILKSISFFKVGIQKVLSMSVALGAEKDLYAEKALSLAKGLVSTSNHNIDMLTIQPRYRYLDVISDICFKSDTDVDRVVNELYRSHKKNSDDRFKKYFPVGVASTSLSTTKGGQRLRSTGANLGYIENIYNQQLLSALSADIRRSITSIKHKDGNDVETTPDVEVLDDSASDNEKCFAETLEVKFTERDRCALLIQRFVCENWIYKQRFKKKQIKIVYSFLSMSILRIRAKAKILKKKKIAISKWIICRAIYNYLNNCKLKAMAAKVIRSNMRILFRNYLFRELSAACILGAKLLIQREWALRHSDTELRILKIETYLHASTAQLPYSISAKPDAPLPKHKIYLSARSWDNITNFSVKELHECNIHILNLNRIEEEQEVSGETISRSLNVFESSCMSVTWRPAREDV